MADSPPSRPDPAGAGEVHEWVSFEVGDETYQFDLTFLTSAWHCIYGQGCPGIDGRPAPELEIGCCSHGAHFADKDDRRHVAALVATLGPEDWQLKDEAEARGGAIVKDAEAGAWVTRTHDGACILLNRPGFAGGAGCALHRAALERGERPVDWKPYVCWQLPLRLEFHTDDNGHLTNIVREWKRRDWGEGGADFHWWCTEAPEAFDGAEPVVVTLRDELVALVGEEPYRALLDHLATRPFGVALPHPTLKKRPGPADRQVL
jgi:hypothetical protein